MIVRAHRYQPGVLVRIRPWDFRSLRVVVQIYSFEWDYQNYGRSRELQNVVAELVAPRYKLSFMP